MAASTAAAGLPPLVLWLLLPLPLPQPPQLSPCCILALCCWCCWCCTPLGGWCCTAKHDVTATSHPACPLPPPPSPEKDPPLKPIPCSPTHPPCAPPCPLAPATCRGGGG